MATPRKARVVTEEYTPGVPQDRKTKATKDSTNRAKAPASLVEIITTDEQDVDLIPLFSIDGRVYSIPGEVSASMALRLLDSARRHGMEAATSEALEELLGGEAYQALLQCRSLKVSHLEQIMEVVQAHVLGDLEGTLGN